MNEHCRGILRVKGDHVQWRLCPRRLDCARFLPRGKDAEDRLCHTPQYEKFEEVKK